jgi:hypothetical protein
LLALATSNVQIGQDLAMEEWLALRERCPWPEQQRYEILRSVVLFGHSPAERALETGVPRASLYRRVQRFKELGMVSLFTDIEADDRRSRPSLPPDMRQFIVDLKAEQLVRYRQPEAIPGSSGWF